MEPILESKTTPTTPTNKHGQSSPWKKKKKFIKPSYSSTPSSPKQPSPKIAPINTTTQSSFYNTPASPGSKLKLFFSKLNSPTKNQHHYNLHHNHIQNNSSTSSSPNEGSSPSSNSSSSTPSPVISSPFGFAHITHVNFDSSNQELTGLPRDWGKTLKRSVNKLVSVRRDSTAQRTLSASGINDNSSSSSSSNSSSVNNKQQQQSTSSSALLMTAQQFPPPPPPPPIKSFEYEIANKLRLSTPDDLAQSIEKSKGEKTKSNRPKSSNSTTSTTTISPSSSPTSNNVQLLSSQESSSSASKKTRKSSPIKLSSPPPTPSPSTSDNELERSLSIISNLVSLSKDTTGSKSMDSLVIGAPTLLRRDIHITWNHVSGQFEGVPPEWQPMLQPITSEKQKKKRMDLRKRLIREESLKCDREERSRQLIRDRRERSRLLRIERRRSVYIPRPNTTSPNLNQQTELPIPQPLPPFKSYSLQNFRLWQISGTELFKTKRVEACFDSLCCNDVFVLDCGKSIYVWMGEGSSLQKQVKGASVANKIKYENDYINDPIIIEFLMDNEKSSEHTEFFRNLTTTTTTTTTNTTTMATTTAQPITINNVFTNNLIINEKVTKIGISDDQILQEEDSEVTWLYKVNDNGKINMIDEKPLVPTSLNSNTCFILDCETDIYVWHGKHSHPLKQKVAVIFAKEFLNIFSARPSWASLHIVHQGEEQWFFKEHFLYWLEDECLVDNSKRNTSTFRFGTSTNGNNGLKNSNVNLPTPIPIDSNFMVSDLFSIPDSYNTKPQSLSPSPSTSSIINNGSSAFSISSIRNSISSSSSSSLLMIDRKQHISLDIWKGEGDQWKKLTKDLYGHFESSKCYVCHHVYKINGKFQSRAFFWQGSEASIRWWIVFQFGLYKELGEHMQMLDSPPPPTECLTQNKESHEFLKLFNNIFIHYTPISANSNSINNGGIPPSISTLSISSISSMNSGISSVNSSNVLGKDSIPALMVNNHNHSSNITNGMGSNQKQTLYQISLIANTFTRSVQYQEFDASCLNSRDMFIFHSFAAKTIFVWHGKGASKELRLISQNIANSILAYYQSTGEISKNEFDLIIDCQEGQEPPIFWKLFLSLSNTDAQSITAMPLEQKRKFYAYDKYYEQPLVNSNTSIGANVDGRIPPKFYHVFYNVKIRTYVVTKISPFSQGDLCEEDSFILDCFYKVFVWFGPDCSNRKRETTKQLAKQYIEESTIGHSLDTTKLVFLDSGEEDAEFRSYFQGWSYSFTLTNWKNNSQSLIGAGADHRLLNSIVSYSSMSSQVDNIGGVESGDEGGGYGYGFGGYADTNSTTTTNSTSVTPLSSSPISSSPGFGSFGSFSLASTSMLGDNSQPLENWELELESTINSIKKKPIFSPKLQPINNKPKKYDTIRQMLDEFDGNNNNNNNNSNIATSATLTSIVGESSSNHKTLNLPPISEPSIDQLDDSNNNSTTTTPLKPPTSPPQSIINSKRTSQQLQSTSPNLSPVLKNRLLELAHVNNSKHRKRGTSETKKFSPLLKTIQNQRDRPTTVLINNKFRNHGGSIDAKSMQVLKLNKVDMELDLEVSKIETELSEIIENIKDNNDNNNINNSSSDNIKLTPVIEEKEVEIQKPIAESIPTPIPTPVPSIPSIPSAVTSPNKKVILKVNVPVKPIEIQKVSMIPLNAITTNTLPSPRTNQYSPRQPPQNIVISPRTQQPQNGNLSSSGNSIPTTTFKTNTVSPRPPSSSIPTNTIISPRVISTNNTVSPRPPLPQQTSSNTLISPRVNTTNNTVLKNSSNNVPLTQPKYINNNNNNNNNNSNINSVPLQSIIGPSSSSNISPPPPLQRTNSVKDRINQVESIVKNLSESINRIPPKPLQRSDSSISFKSTINTSSNPLPKSTFSEPITPKCAPASKAFIR